MEILCESSLVREMHERSRAALPGEACGLLGGLRAGPDWRLDRFVETANLHDQVGAFAVDPLDFLRVDAGFRREHRELLALFHSHPSGSLQLSKLDRQSGWTELVFKLTEPMEENAYVDAMLLETYDLPPGWQIVVDERLGTDPAPGPHARTDSSTCGRGRGAPGCVRYA